MSEIPETRESLLVRLKDPQDREAGDLLGVWREGRPIGQLEVVSVSEKLSNARLVKKTDRGTIRKGDDVGVISGWTAFDDLTPVTPAVETSAPAAIFAEEDPNAENASNAAKEPNDRTEN